MDFQPVHSGTHTWNTYSYAGGTLGAIMAKRMEVTDLPQMVALFHSLVGAAAVITCVANHMAEFSHLDTVMRTTVFLGTLIGGITFTGSLIAFGKLQGTTCAALMRSLYFVLA